MIQLGPSRVSMVNGEELDDEKDIGCPICLASEVVVLQPNAGVSFTIILDDVAWHSEMLSEASVTDGPSKHFASGSSGMRLLCSRSSWPLRRGFHVWCWDYASLSSRRC
jgi:hypothetical protein